MKLTICLITRSLPFHIRGGMERHVEDLMNGLARIGHEVYVITSKNPEGKRVLKFSDNITVFSVGSKIGKYSRRFFLESATLFKALDSKIGIDLIHSQSIAGAGIVKYVNPANTPVITTLHGTFLNDVRSMLYTKSLKSFLIATYLLGKRIFDLERYDRLLMKNSEKIIAVSNFLAESIKQEYPFISKEKITIIYNGVDTERFRPMKVSEQLRDRFGINDEKVIFSIGRVEREKGFHLLIKTVKEISKKIPVKLIIGGEGTYLKYLKKLSISEGIHQRIIFTGRIPDHELPIYYNLGDIVVFPTLRLEAFPIVLIEAMACGKPVIASKIGGTPEIIQNWKDGLLVEAGDINDLKDKLQMVLHEEKLSKELSKNARDKVVKYFSLDTMLRKYCSVYNQTLQNN